MEEYLHDKYDEIVRLLEELKDYTKFHFADEENYMQSIQYEGLAAQKRAHDAFVARLEEMNFEHIDEHQQETLEEMIYESCLIKKAVVEKDPLEQGERALLNFGHTIGHALEKYKDFTMFHGECVALGCVAAAWISWKRELLSMEEYYEIRDMFVPFGLPITVDSVDVEEILRLTRSDKKMEHGQIKFVLLKKIGKAVVDKTITEEEMRTALEEIVFDGKERE